MSRNIENSIKYSTCERTGHSEEAENKIKEVVVVRSSEIEIEIESKRDTVVILWNRYNWDKVRN